MIRLILTKKPVILKTTLGIFFLFFSFINSLIAQTTANEVVLYIIINGEQKGDIFSLIEEDKIFLPIDDLTNFGLKKIGGKKVVIQGKEYLLLNSWGEVKFKLNEERAELEIIVPPKYLPETTISLHPRKRENVEIPNQNSAFLNYRFDYTRMEDINDFFFNHELGFRIYNWSFITEGFYSDEKNKYTRLNTFAVFDDRKALTRLVLGDFVTPSSTLSSGNPFIGISYYKNFNIDPYFIYKPAFNINTFANFRSELEIYLDNTLIRKEFVQPGSINLSDLYYYGGRKDIQIIIKDPYGRLEIYRYPFYFSDTMLKEGIREFNYSIGFMRKNYSIDSNNYTNLGFLIFERYGVNNFLNLGGRLEGVPVSEFYNLNLETAFLLNNYGILSIIPSFSIKNNLYGSSIMSSYNYQFKNFALRTSGFISSDKYSSYYKPTSEQVQKSFNAGVSYFIEKLGNFSIDFSHNKFKNFEKNLFNFGYSKSIKGNMNIFANFSKKYEQKDITEFFVGISIYPKKEYTLSLRYEDIESSNIETLQLSKSAPISEGYGYRVTVEREKIKQTYNSINPYFQYRTNFGVSEFDINLKNGPDKTLEIYRISHAGAIAFIGNNLGFTRPINDSFALIKTADLEGVTVNLNGQNMGKTNKKGYLFISDLSSYYDNTLTINDKDIPFEYDILTKDFVVSPWYKSGFCLEFPIKKVFRYSGKLLGIINDKIIPLEYYIIHFEQKDSREVEKNNCIRLSEKELPTSITTGKNGEFYIEDLKPGIYRSFIIYDGNPIEFEITLPETPGFITELGDIKIELIEKNKKIPDKIMGQEKKYKEIILEEKVSEIKKSEKLIEIKKIPHLSKPEGKESGLALSWEKKEEILAIRQFQQEDLKSFETQTTIIKVYFKFDSTKLASKKDYITLKEIAKNIIYNDIEEIEIFGHADQLGSKRYNLKLSEKRAKYIKNKLIKLGVNKEKIKRVKGLGNTYLVCDSLKESCRKYNRRVEIHIVEKQ